MELAASVPCRSAASHALSSKLSNGKHTPLQASHSRTSEGSSSPCSSSLYCCSSKRSTIVSYTGCSLPQRRSSMHFSAAAASDASIPLAESDANPPFRELLSEGEDFPSSSVASLFTSQRMKVGALVAIAMALCNADRVIMSVAIVNFSTMYNWSTSFAGIVQSSFLWGYMLSPIVGGALVDHYGGKVVMAYGLALWSLATYLTPSAAKQSVWMLFAIRMLMGLAEGVAMPCMNNMVSRWFPRSERARAVGMTMAGFHLGSVIGLVATPVIMGACGVHMPFIAFGLAGAVWLYFWLSFVSNDPQDHPFIGKSELHYIQKNRVAVFKGVPASGSSGKEAFLSLKLLLRKIPAWAIIVANFTNNWGYFVLLSWMPVYFNSVYGVNLKQASWFSALPWTMMAALGYVAASCSDFLVESGLNVTTVRKIMQSIGFLGPALALLAVNASSSATAAAIWLTVAIGTSSFSQAGFLVNFQEIAPGRAGVLQGIANTVGTMGAIISTIGIGYFVQWLGSFQAFLTLTAAIYVVSTLFWNFSATGERVIE